MDLKFGFCAAKLHKNGVGMLFGRPKVGLDKSMPTKTSITFIHGFLDRLIKS